MKKFLLLAFMLIVNSAFSLNRAVNNFLRSNSRRKPTLEWLQKRFLSKSCLKKLCLNYTSAESDGFNQKERLCPKCPKYLEKYIKGKIKKNEEHMNDDFEDDEIKNKVNSNDVSDNDTE